MFKFCPVIVFLLYFYIIQDISVFFFFFKDIFRCLCFQKLPIFSVLWLSLLMTVLKIVTIFEKKVFCYCTIFQNKMEPNFVSFLVVVFEPQAFKCCKLTDQFATARTHFLAFSPNFLKMDKLLFGLEFCVQISSSYSIYVIFSYYLGYVWKYF